MNDSGTADTRESEASLDPLWDGMKSTSKTKRRSDHRFNGIYSGAQLNRIALPMGGMGAGMLCLEGNGALSHFSLHHHPDLLNEPQVYAAISINGANRIARVLEGPVPPWKLSPRLSKASILGGYVGGKATLGLPRFREASFEMRFPFGAVVLRDEHIPLRVRITGWSPFEPGDEDNASLPVAALEYELENHCSEDIEAVFSFHARNFMATSAATGNKVGRVQGGFSLHGGAAPETPWQAGSFAISTDDHLARVNAWKPLDAWGTAMREFWAAWQNVEQGNVYERHPVTDGPPASGASLFVPVQLRVGETKTIVVRFAWYVPKSKLSRVGGKFDAINPFESTDPPTDQSQCYQPWYAGRFSDVGEVHSYWTDAYSRLKKNTERFTNCFYDSTLPGEVIEAVGANLTILKSPTVLRGVDGRFWAWEGCGDDSGLCSGSCSHVWNYAQALPHLFPRLERTLRETEFFLNQDAAGHQDFRSALPARETPHDLHAAADGQLGGIMKAYRDWRISGDTDWMRYLWPRIRDSLDYCIRTWDPRREGWLEEPHHNTYDVEFWGPNGMCTSMYLGALKTAVLIGSTLQEDVGKYAALLKKGVEKTQSQLFNGEYFAQTIRWTGLDVHLEDAIANSVTWALIDPSEVPLRKTTLGPPFQYGPGCLSDGVIGSWMALVCGVEDPLSDQKVRSHLSSVHRYNFRKDLTSTANLGPDYRATFATGSEGGLILCSWPRGGTPSLPFFYAAEVWTGVEYQSASHMIALGLIEEGLEVVRACRCRYDGSVRNPFAEVETGYWYGRAMSSYALLQALAGARYDAVDKILYLRPQIKGDFRCFLSTATGYGTVGIRHGRPFVDVASGSIPYAEIKWLNE